jgi:LPXTG-motif cell wall-anchored protein
MNDAEPKSSVAEDNSEDSPKGRKQKIARWRRFIEVLFTGLLGVLASLGFEAISKISPKLTGFLHVWWLTLLGTICVLLIGVGLFFFRKYRQREYGLIEIAFALAAGWSGVMKVQSTNDMTSWTTVVAAAYLVVRGLSNYDEARIKKKLMQGN